MPGTRCRTCLESEGEKTSDRLGILVHGRWAGSPTDWPSQHTTGASDDSTGQPPPDIALQSAVPTGAVLSLELDRVARVQSCGRPTLLASSVASPAVENSGANKRPSVATHRSRLQPRTEVGRGHDLSGGPGAVAVTPSDLG